MNLKPLKSILKNTGFALLALIIILLLFLFVGLKTDIVQKQLGKTTSNYLSKKTDTKVEIEKIAIHLFDRVALKNAYFEDPNTDTLFAAKKIIVDIDLKKLRKKIVEIDKVIIDDLNFNLIQSENKKFNFQHFIDAFAPKQPKKKKEQKKPWDIKLKNLSLNKTNAILDLKSGKQDIKLEALEIDLKSFDFENLIIEANDISIHAVHYIAQFIKPENSVIKKKIDLNKFPLYTIPIKVISKNLSIVNSFVDIKTGKNENLGDVFNPQRIYAENLNIDFKDVYLDSTKASVSANNISTLFGQYIDIVTLSGDLQFASNETSAYNLNFKTGRSNAKMKAHLKYDDFKTFLSFADQLNVDISGNPINVHCAEVFYFIPKLSETLDCSQFPSNKLKLLTNINGNLSNLRVQKLDASMAAINLKISGNIKHPTNMDKMQLQDVSLTVNSPAKAIENIIGIDKLPVNLNPLGNVRVNSLLSGNLNMLQLNQLKLETDLETEVDLNGNIQNLNDIKDLKYELQIDHINTGVADLNQLIDSLPEFLSSIDQIQYVGQLKGSTTSFDLNGELNTNLGNVIPNLKIDFNQSYTDAIYKGKIEIEDFQLGQLLKNDSIGNISMTANVDGRGLSLDTIDTRIDAIIKSFTYNSYEYNNLKIDGLVEQKEFTGAINMKDENIDFAFEGELGINDNLPDFNFTMQIDTLNLQALNLSKDPISLSMEIASDLDGRSIDDLNGELRIKDIKLLSDNKTWLSDSLVLNITSNENLDKKLTIQSEVLNGEVVGNYKLSTLYSSIINSVDHYFPVSELLKIEDKDQNLTDQNFDAELYVSDITTVSQLFVPTLKELDTASIKISYDSRENSISFQADVPALELTTGSMKNLKILGQTEEDELAIEIESDNIKVGSRIYLPSAVISTSFKDGTGQYEVQIKNDSSIQEFDLSGDISRNDGLLEIAVNQNLILDGQEWNLGLKDPIKIGNGKFEYPSFNLIKEDEGILLSKSNDDVIELYFESFEISHITNFIYNDSTSLDGSINGTLLIAPKADPLTIEGDLFISTIQYNGVDLGNIGMIFENIGASFTSATIELTDLFTDVQIEAILSEGQNIDAEININQFDLKAIEPFLSKHISNVEGGMEGFVTIGGSLNAPEISGLIDINDVSAKVNALGSYYAVEEGHIDIEKDNIITSIDFVDSLQRKAKLDGNIRHNYFQDIRFNLNLSAESFTFLDTEKQKGLPFYGKLNAELDADITGSIQKPEIFAIFATDEATDVVIQTITNNTSITNEPYVIFVDRNDYSETEIDSIVQLRYNIKTIFDLTVYANINDKANLKVIIDPISGDYLDVKGNGNIVVDVTESGELLLNGGYTVSSGEYRFTFQDFFLKRNFDIVPGGEITFVGDIMSSNLDIEAAYKLKTSTYSLVENEFETLSDDEKETAKDPTTDVEVILGISGQLSEPEINFDIRIPQNSGNIVSSSVTRALEKLRSNKTELNTQVFSLLLLQGFTTSNWSSNAINTGTQIAYNSVSSFINNQLKKLTNKAKGLEVGVGIASSNEINEVELEGEGTESSINTSTNIDLFIKQSLLNDRLSLQIGGNVDLNSGSSEGGLTNVAGDFVLEYKLTKDGNLRMNVFQKSDYSVLNDNNVWKTGLGLSYQKTFGKIGGSNHQKKNKEKRKKKAESSNAIKNEQEGMSNNDQ